MKERRKKDLQIRKEGEGENSEKLFKFPRVTFFDERVPPSTHSRQVYGPSKIECEASPRNGSELATFPKSFFPKFGHRPFSHFGSINSETGWYGTKREGRKKPRYVRHGVITG